MTTSIIGSEKRNKNNDPNAVSKDSSASRDSRRKQHSNGEVTTGEECPDHGGRQDSGSTEEVLPEYAVGKAGEDQQCQVLQIKPKVGSKRQSWKG